MSSTKQSEKLLELNTKSLTQNVISTKDDSYFGVKIPKYGNPVNCEPILHRKEDIFILVNETEFVPHRKTVYRNIPFDLNCKLAEFLIFPRYRGTFVMKYFDSISHINSITFKLVAERIMDAIQQSEFRLKLKVLTPTDISYDMFENVRSAALKRYLHRFVVHSHSSAKGDS